MGEAEDLQAQLLQPASPSLPPSLLGGGEEIREVLQRAGMDRWQHPTALRLGTEGARCSGKLLSAQGSPIEGPNREHCCAMSPHPSP